MWSVTFAQTSSSGGTALATILNLVEARPGGERARSIDYLPPAGGDEQSDERDCFATRSVSRSFVLL